MKKLFLTSFAFKTGDVEYKEHRLVVVTKDDVTAYIHDHEQDGYKSDDPELSVAYEKFTEWFPKMYPESELIYHIAHPAIV